MNRSAPNTGAVPASLVVAAGLFLFTLALYLAHLPPGMTWKNNGADGGDLATAVETWGVPHPPGYPTYVLLGRLFRLLPGETAYNLNTLSAAAGAATVAFAFLAALELAKLLAAKGSPVEDEAQEPRGEYLPAAVGALCLGLAPLFWSQAIITEVYTLNTLFAALTVWLVCVHLRLRRAGGAGSGRVLFAAFLFGLGLGNHFTLAAISVPLLTLTLWRERRRWRLLAGAAACAACGLAVFAYVPLAASGTPIVNWGRASTAEGFLWLITAAPYKSYLFGVPAVFWTARLSSWSSLMLLQFNGLGVVLALAGLWWMCRRDWQLTLCLLAGFLAVSLYATLYASLDSLVFLLPALFVVALWISLGTRALFTEVLLPRIGEGMGRAWRMTLMAAGLIVVLVPGIALIRTYPSGHGLSLNLRGDREATDFAQAAFRTMEPDALVFAHADQPIFTLLYQRHVLETGSRVTVVSRELLQFQWYRDNLADREPNLALPLFPEGEFGEAMRAMTNAEVSRRPVYVTLEDPVLEGYVLEKRGPLWKVTRPA